jgi:predicted DNA-binding transcriptional regulator YafY
MNKFDRVVAILIQLQSRRVVKAQDLAERFEVSLRTIYRDIRTLEDAGVPIVGEAGIGYSIMDGYRLPPVMFTVEEATAFVTAEKMVNKLTDEHTSQEFKSALYKVKAVLRSAEKEFLEDIDDRIEVVSFRRRQPSKEAPQSLPSILRSIAERRVISIDYYTRYKQENTTRKVEPMGVFLLNDSWHLIAYCQMRTDYRDFRIDRISNIRPTGDFYKNRHPTLGEYLELIDKERKLIKIVVQVDQYAAKFLEEEKYLYGFASETNLGEWVEMTFLVDNMEGFARYCLRFADRANIVEPEALRERIRSLAQAIAARL